jgi:hypothetical protein
MKNILIKHDQKYPHMEIQDFLKLIYQRVFGPRHLHQPTLEAIKKYIQNELSEHIFEIDDSLVPIGGGFIRLPLSFIKQKKMNIQDCAELFLKSMQTSPIRNEKRELMFKKYAHTLLDLIASKVIKFDYDDAKNLIQTYIDEGIKPMHHSNMYKDMYKPAYRVIKQKYLIDYFDHAKSS